MRKMFCCVGLFSMSVLLSSVAVAKEARNYKINASRNVPSECDQVVDNLVSNCGFETGGFDSWAQSGDLSFSSVDFLPHSGNFAAVMGPVNDLGFLTQNLPTTADQSYTLSFWLANSFTPNRFQVSWDGGVIFDATDLPDQPYTLTVFEGLVASADGTDVQFGFYNVPDYIDLDDVVVN